MKYFRPLASFVIGAAVCALIAGCAIAPTQSQQRPPNGGKVTSRLSVARVKEIAAARARANGFQVEASAPWTVALQVNEHGYLWVVTLVTQNGPAPYWLHVDDATGGAEFVMPIFQGQQKFAEDADWLIKVDESLKRSVYPIELESLMRAAHFATATPTGGGTTTDGRFFFDYTLREEKDIPARFEVRCYYTMPQGMAGPKIVIAADLAYVDAKTYRYLLVRYVN